MNNEIIIIVKQNSQNQTPFLKSKLNYTFYNSFLSHLLLEGKRKLKENQWKKEKKPRILFTAPLKKL